MHYKSGFGQRCRSSTSPASEFKQRSRYIPKLLTQKAHIRSGLGPAGARHNIINLHVETWLCVNGLRHKMVLLKSGSRSSPIIADPASRFQLRRGIENDNRLPARDYSNSSKKNALKSD
jgi:hypothetical protein